MSMAARCMRIESGAAGTYAVRGQGLAGFMLPLLRAVELDTPPGAALAPIYTGYRPIPPYAANLAKRPSCYHEPP